MIQSLFVRYDMKMSLNFNTNEKKPRDGACASSGYIMHMKV